MAVTVCKFGGTSLANADNIKRVRDIIHSDPHRSIIVVSAPGKRNKSDVKITDLLFQIYDLKEKGENFDAEFLKFAKRFYDIEKNFKLQTNLKELLDEFYAEVPGQNLDYMASTGEFFMAKMMAEILGFEFVNIDKTSVIAFDKGGKVDLAMSCKNFTPFKGKKIVVPGFYGIMPDGAIKTFPRGGSDITGAVIANIANATLYENWTDVDGVYDKDPNKYPDAKKFDRISYDQVEALARKGANVLHPDCIAYVREKSIPINLKNTFNPSNPGTLIHIDY